MNSVPPGVNEGYDTLGVGSVIELGVHLALLVKRRTNTNLRKKKPKSMLISSVFFFAPRGDIRDIDASDNLQTSADN